MRCRINQGQAQAREKAMKLYAVRMIETCLPVGLFWAKDVSDLAIAIDFDDVMSPTRCEYLTIETTGALVWYDHESWQLGEPPGEADDLAAFEQRVEQVRENISFDGSLFALIYKGEAKGSWQCFSARRRPMRSWRPRLPKASTAAAACSGFPRRHGQRATASQVTLQLRALSSDHPEDGPPFDQVAL
jgi:hypothetical protein